MHKKRKYGKILWLAAISGLLVTAGCARLSEAPRQAAPPPALVIAATHPKALRHQPEVLFAPEPADVDVVTLDALIEAVLRANPEVQADLAYYEGRLQKAPQQRALPDPMAQFEVMVADDDSTTYALQLVQPIPWPKRLRLKGQLAEKEAAIAFESHQIRLLDIVHELSRRYYELAFEYASLDLVREEKAYIDQLLETAGVGYAVGRHGRQALLKAQTESARLDNVILAYPGRIEALRAALRARVGDLAVADALLAQRRTASLNQVLLALPDAPQEDLLAEAMRLLPEATQLDHKIELGQIAHSLARADYVPDFMVGIKYMYMDNEDRSKSARAPMTVDAGGMAAPSPRDTGGMSGAKDRNSVEFMVGFTIPIPNARRRAQLLEARAMENEARLRKHALTVNTATALEAAFSRLYSLADQYTVYESTLIPLAVDAYETSRAEYETGVGGYLDLLDAQRTFLRLRHEQLEIKRDCLLLIADIQRVTGARFIFEQTHSDHALGEQAYE